jgi:hypothetical protein
MPAKVMTPAVERATATAFTTLPSLMRDLLGNQRGAKILLAINRDAGL